MGHDYLTARAWIKSVVENRGYKHPQEVAFYKDVLHALAMMQKLNEIPSLEMLKAAQPYFNEQQDCAGFKAMLEQAEKEIEG